MTGTGASGGQDRREVLTKGAGALLAVSLTGGLAGSATAAARMRHPIGSSHHPDRGSVDDLVLETVTGPMRGADVTFAMAHEHLFVDFLGPTDPGYMDVNWSQVTAACANGCAAGSAGRKVLAPFRTRDRNSTRSSATFKISKNIMRVKHLARNM